MKKNSSSDDLKKSTTLGWKFVALVAGITIIFFTFLYLAMSNDPDYMPNRPPKVKIQTEITTSTSSATPTNSAE